jgi:hypothetical protein
VATGGSNVPLATAALLDFAESIAHFIGMYAAAPLSTVLYRVCPIAGR